MSGSQKLDRDTWEKFKVAESGFIWCRRSNIEHCSGANVGGSNVSHDMKMLG